MPFLFNNSNIILYLCKKYTNHEKGYYIISFGKSVFIWLSV